MPRTYVQVPDKKRTYGYSLEEKLVEAARDMKTNKLSFRKAAVKHDVKRSTLKDFVGTGSSRKKAGGQCLFTPVEEKELADIIDAVVEWGFPVNPLEARLIARDLAASKNVEVRTKSGVPGNDWYEGFIQRNKISERAASNMRRSRAKVNSAMINEYFDEVEKLFNDFGQISPENVYNYDETNFQNDPGKSIVLCRRGRKRVEVVQDYSKQCFSVMWCGNAAGELMPPMIVYKSKNVYTGWTTGGPKNAVYDCTESGWFDSGSFKTWFLEVFLPSTKTKRGPIFLFGDNLSSHFSWKLVKLARKHRIYFVMLLANSTHLLQVLDVAVFGPMKRSWRLVLLDWRMKTRRNGDIPKEVFPQLLKALDERVRLTVEECLKSGFRACGLYPLNRNEVLKKLPDQQLLLTKDQANSVLNDSVMEMLRKYRESKEDEKSSKRGKKLPRKIPNLMTVIPGRALIVSDERESLDQVVPSDDDPFAHLVEEAANSESCVASNDERPSVDEEPREEEEEEEDIRFPKKPTARSLRKLGLTKTKKSLLKSRPHKRTPSWSCTRCNKSADLKLSRWIKCDGCGNDYHLYCAGVKYDKVNYWTLNTDDLIFNCEQCQEKIRIIGMQYGM